MNQLSPDPTGHHHARPNAATAQNLTVRAEPEGEYVLGLPMPMALTLSVNKPGTVINLMPAPTPFALMGCIGLTLATVEGRAVCETIPGGKFDLTHQPPTLSMGFGEARRFLIDVSAIVPDDLAPERYQATLTYLHPKMRVESEPMSFVVREPTEEEAAWRKTQASTLEDAGSWGQWTLEPPLAPATTPDILKTPRHAIFYAACRYLIHAQAPLAELDNTVLAAVQGVARPEAKALQMEARHSANPGAITPAAVADAAKQTPGIGWRIEAIRNQSGLIANHRPQP